MLHNMQGQPITDTDALRSMFAPGSLWASEAGDKVRKIRRERKWSLDTLAELTGCNASTLSRIESGAVVPRFYLMAAIAYALTVEIDDIWPMPSRRRIRERAA